MYVCIVTLCICTLIFITETLYLAGNVAISLGMASLLKRMSNIASLLSPISCSQCALLLRLLY